MIILQIITSSSFHPYLVFQSVIILCQEFSFISCCKRIKLIEFVKIIKLQIMPIENIKRCGDFPLLMMMLVVANKCPPTSMNHGGCLNCLFNYNRPWWACGQMLLQLELYLSISYFLCICVCVLTIANVYNSFCKYNGRWTKIQNSLKFQRRERTEKMD